ncbi:FliH/SctL family protein [Sphingomonas sp.]|uniref:FliH/SctL family protein n=1 Tax=Sphingomonas sp. TaxID=28214 RepID=UPI001B19A472|nr:FliH/SctL family protein [Sphingomonas sp.]MBO9713929.1 flagellar biosynthesis protein FliH [Sphingomonas sp.]
MSDFVPGFSARQSRAAAVLHQAFAGMPGFAPAPVEGIGRRGFVPASAQVEDEEDEPELAPRHFSPADPSRNPTEGWDPFAPDAVTAARAEGFAEGRALALLEIGEVRARETALLDQVSTALAGGAHFDRERMAGHLRQTVLHLVTRLIGEAGIAPDVLAARVKAAIDLLADSAESALLRLHPDDVALVEGKLPTTIFAVADPHIARGGFVIESASTIVEDGPGLWLEQLAQAIDRVPIPPLC